MIIKNEIMMTITVIIGDTCSAYCNIYMSHTNLILKTILKEKQILSSIKDKLRNKDSGLFFFTRLICGEAYIKIQSKFRVESFNY